MVNAPEQEEKAALSGKSLQKEKKPPPKRGTATCGDSEKKTAK